MRGASTITQQVARMLFLQDYMRGGVFARSGTVGLERKIKEAMLAFQLEKRYTKREILAFYANHVPLDHGAYGVEAAARMYFDKSAKDLSLEEAASIAAIIPTPSRLSPFRNPEQNLARRNNYVLRRMSEEGFITREEAADAAKRPLVLQGQPAPQPLRSRRISSKTSARCSNRSTGLTPCIRPDFACRRRSTSRCRKPPIAHSIADCAGSTNVEADYRKPARNVLAEGKDIETFRHERWSQAILAGDIVPAVVTFVPGPKERGNARVRIGSHEVDLPAAAFQWTRRTSPANLFKVGDLIEVEVRELDGDAPTTLALEQPPLVEGALLAIDNETGQVRAMVGGFDFARSKFNRATQARRQVGSLFKPIVYTAAIDRGFTPVSIFVDEPVSYEPGPNQPPYEPLNYDRKFEGPVTLRHALEDSRNIPAVKAMADIGPAEVVRYAKQFGFKGDYQPFLSLALGAAEATLVEVTSAYSAFPNRGVRMEPYSIVSIADREGNVLEETRPNGREAVRADTAFVMTNLLHGVVLHGTGEAAKVLDWPLAGKTGTMDDYTDAWFVGFDPKITVGVWVGYDEKKPLGNGETGAQAALPIWIDFMRAYIDARGDRNAPPTFDAPGNIVFVTLDSGLPEAFINGTQPAGLTAPADSPARARRPAGTGSTGGRIATCRHDRRARTSALAGAEARALPITENQITGSDVRRMFPAPDDVPLVASQADDSQDYDDGKHLQRIEESRHDERNGQQAVHHH